MMLKVLFCVFVLTGSESLFANAFRGRPCSDCVSIRSCDSAMHYARRLHNGILPKEDRNTFFGSICKHAKNETKVCCSDFPVLETGYRAGGFVRKTPEVDPIETHPNIALLPSECGDSDRARIINGNIAQLYEFPWMTLIAYNTSIGIQFHCAGSIINSRYILTAAHCVANITQFKKIAGVRIGDLDYYNDNDCQGYYQDKICENKIQDIGVDEIIPHESFNGKLPIEADIALIRLKETIIMYNNAAPICLPRYSNLRNANLAGKEATVAGWGITENNTASSVLMKVKIPIKSSDTCNSYYNRYENQKPMDKAFCAGSIMKDSCEGDSGAPVMIESDYNHTRRIVQFGIVSYGPKKCGSEFPGVYTDVTKYMDWILDNMRE
ncbi:melanization protease 1-like [Pararge aegeria]|uniref:CLIP domain-containing serine protease n=1 Tax=Pararge aegeria aegeria TaxID=348720 RepID=A0A8S4RYX1_9NEOP|nr:melanization protease 1-like [Pararge aegeria]CAH2242386.1 jg12967 [Pararge aegeria aegeria]